MPTTQSEDPNERVNHPRHYNQHPSGVECIELIEHLTGNLHSATKYVWRCGLKTTETPLRDLQAALWYTNRESVRIDLYELDDKPKPHTEVVWRAIARRIIASDDTALGYFLSALLNDDYGEMIEILEQEIVDEKKREPAPRLSLEEMRTFTSFSLEEMRVFTSTETNEELQAFGLGWLFRASHGPMMSMPQAKNWCGITSIYSPSESYNQTEYIGWERGWIAADTLFSAMVRE